MRDAINIKNKDIPSILNNVNIDIADIVQIVDSNNGFNPVIKSPNSIYELTYYQTKETLDIENYKMFLDNTVAAFRHSIFYTQYKEYLYNLGLNVCQVLGISSDMATVEMHHNFLNIHDIAYIICEHILNTVGKINSFQLIHLLKEEHRENRVPIVMLSKTAHQLFHNNKNFTIPAQMCFGFWTELLMKYNKGISLELGNKIIYYINNTLEYKESNYTDIPDNDLLNTRSKIAEWGAYNEYSRSLSTNQIITDINSNSLYNNNISENNRYTQRICYYS